MKKLLLTAIAIALMATLGLYAQEKDTAQVEPKVKLEMVWEKEFESSILDFTYSDGENGPTLQVVITTDKVQFLTKETREIPTRSFQLNWDESWVYGASLSKNGEYIGISKHHYGDYGRIQKGSEFQVYDKTGNLLTTREVTNNYKPGILLNNGAFLVTGVLEDARIFVEQLDGTKKIIFDYDNMRPSTYIGIAKNGNTFVLNISGIGVKLYNNNGEEIWQHKFSWGDAANVAISDYGNYIAAVGILSGGGVYLFSSNGNLLWKYPAENYYNFYLNCMDFSPDEKYFAANINRDDIYLFESSTGKVFWNYKLKEDSRKFFSICISKNADYVAAADGGGRRELPSGDSSTVFLFDKQGNVVWQQKLKIRKERAPSVRFTDDGRYLLICNSNTLCCYKIVGGGQ